VLLGVVYGVLTGVHPAHEVEVRRVGALLAERVTSPTDAVPGAA
jgi:hypothetical protein